MKKKLLIIIPCILLLFILTIFVSNKIILSGETQNKEVFKTDKCDYCSKTYKSGLAGSIGKFMNSLSGFFRPIFNNNCYMEPPDGYYITDKCKWEKIKIEEPTVTDDKTIEFLKDGYTVTISKALYESLGNNISSTGTKTSVAELPSRNSSQAVYSGTSDNIDYIIETVFTPKNYNNIELELTDSTKRYVRMTYTIQGLNGFYYVVDANGGFAKASDARIQSCKKIDSDYYVDTTDFFGPNTLDNYINYDSYSLSLRVYKSSNCQDDYKYVKDKVKISDPVINVLSKDFYWNYNPACNVTKCKYGCNPNGTCASKPAKPATSKSLTQVVKEKLLSGGTSYNFKNFQDDVTTCHSLSTTLNENDLSTGNILACIALVQQKYNSTATHYIPTSEKKYSYTNMDCYEFSRGVYLLGTLQDIGHPKDHTILFSANSSHPDIRSKFVQYEKQEDCKTGDLIQYKFSGGGHAHSAIYVNSDLTVDANCSGQIKLKSIETYKKENTGRTFTGCWRYEP